jgi:tetratricopeptide (TPR) repeat protein
MTAALVETLRAVAAGRERRDALRRASPTRETVTGLLAEARSWRRRDPATATLLARSALAVARAGKDPALAAEAAHVLGQAELLLGRPRRALRHQRAAAARAEPSIRMSVALETASSLDLLGHESEARSALADARRLLPARHRAPIGALIDLTEANLLARLDRDADALELYARARRVLARRKQSAAVAALDGNRANSLANLHRYAEADRTYAKAARLHRRLGQEAMAARVDYNRAYLHHLRGDFARAVRELRAMRERFAASGDEHHVGLCDLDLAEVHLRLDEPEDAARHARASVETLSRLGFAHESARARLFLAAAIRGLGRADEARAALETARAALRDVGSAAWEAVASHRLAEIDWEQGVHDRAARRAHEAAERLFGLGLVERGGRADVLAARVDLARGNPEAARRRLEALAVRMRGVHAPWLACEMRRTWARVLAAQGRPRAALRQALAAVRLLERHRMAVPPDEHRASYLREKAAVHDLAVRLTLDVGGRDAVDRARMLAQRGREGPAVDRLARGRPSGAVPAALARCGVLASEIDALLGRMPTDEPHRRAGAASRASALAAERDRRLGACLRRVRGRGDAEATTPARLRRSLPHGVALVELEEGEDDVVAFVSRRGSLRAERLPLSRAMVLALVGAIRESLAGNAPPGVDATAAALRAASEAVLAPLSAAIGDARRVVVVAPGALRSVPFEAAPREVVLAPSASAYLRAAATGPGRGSAAPVVVSMADAGPPDIQEGDFAAPPQAGRPRAAPDESRRDGADVTSTSDAATERRGRRTRRRPRSDRAEVVVLTGVPASAPEGAVAAFADDALRAGASSVVAPLWPVDPGPERRFVDALRAALEGGTACVAAVRAAAEAVAARHPGVRHRGAWCVFGSGGPLREVT